MVTDTKEQTVEERAREVWETIFNHQTVIGDEVPVQIIAEVMRQAEQRAYELAAVRLEAECFSGCAQIVRSLKDKTEG